VLSSALEFEWGCQSWNWEGVGLEAFSLGQGCWYELPEIGLLESLVNGTLAFIIRCAFSCTSLYTLSSLGSFFRLQTPTTSDD
jgi:hypothetical protein